MANVKKARLLRMLFCDFCGQSQEHAEILIQGRDLMHICAACVTVCIDMIVKDRELKAISERQPALESASSTNAVGQTPENPT